MRISTSKSKNSICYYIIKDYTKNGKRTTKKIDTIGNIKKVTELASKENIDIQTWLNNYLKNYIKEHSVDQEEIVIKKYSGKLIPKNQKNFFNVGYLFLEYIYYDLKLNAICKYIEDKYQFKFNLNDILSNLEYARIIYPSSKYKTHKLSKNFIEQPSIELHNIYRSLTYLNNEMDYIQETLYKNSLNVIDRNSKILYFDCTNYYFEITEEDEIRRYGVNKQHQPKPQIGMGLFMDGDGIPIAMNLYPGNENEIKHCLPTENKIVNNFKEKDTQIIICTDAAMCTDEIKNFNIQDGRGFVITQSLKKIKEDYKIDVFKDNDWRISGDLYKTYNIKDIQNSEELSEKYYDTIFYRIIPTETKHVKQDLIVTFSIKYRDYQSNLRNNQIERAKKKIKESKAGEKITLNHNQNDYRRFIKEKVEISKNNKENNSNETKTNEEYNYTYSIDEDIIKEETKYDGYYGLTTNLNDNIDTILKISKGRWEIEESFRIMKTDFKSRPVELSREDRIKAHFLTCFIALLIFRILEKKLDYKYTTTEILDCIRNMNVLELKGDGYVPAYERTDLTDDLHDKFSFRTDFEINSYKNYKKIFNKLKK